ncbi:helix-turn-helix domain-containing protein [Nostocoides sp. Soil756]|jgi:transcriptional regulator with XRE-family HTH domain|uniref:helix-turn-helix domain-containing protein n=1 Tax=Nostocoides sp. Soil756 TaxID=1736399 RepID=UPI0007004E64|nr:helix-turn-helix domain-containing protein [Tetrasphaera sp. Soil756]KRE61035.1 hypothetical protein ASG78_11815 [Tetrasphaera sp. Soil756]
MNRHVHAYPTFAQELLAARAALGPQEVVGLALRADRRRRGLSQRAYARLRGWSPSWVARLESAAGRLKLDDLVEALEGTGYELAVCETSHPREDPGDDDEPRPPPVSGGAALPVPVPADHWDRTELIARVRGGGRRFPAHHLIQQVSYPPNWWWGTESTQVGSVAPHWYADPGWGPSEPRQAS